MISTNIERLFCTDVVSLVLVERRPCTELSISAQSVNSDCSASSSKLLIVVSPIRREGVLIILAKASLLSGELITLR